MELISKDNLMTLWLSLSNIQINISNELESVLQRNHQLSLNEYYVLLFLSEAPNKKLKLQQLQNMVGLSQSALSRLVSRFEAKGCGTLKRHVCIDDRRAIFTSLTPEGENKLKEASRTFKETLEKLVSDKLIQEELGSILISMKR